MNRIARAFENKKAFIAFITAGDPSIEKTEEFIRRMAEGGADLIEIGIPFSDPIAEGVVIQEADIRALAAGTTTDKIFAMVKRLRETLTIPLVLMTYLNPVFHYGYEKFFGECQACGIDGIIIPDLPFEEKHEVQDVAEGYGVEVISMIAPTSQTRIRQIAREARGFIYVVSSMGVTGIRQSFSTNLEEMLAGIKQVTKKPSAIGFGISTPEQAKTFGKIADGVIVGSAIIKIIAQYKEAAGDRIFEYVTKMKNALREL